MKKKQRTLWISETAVFIALLVVLQAATRPLGSTLITGCIVNLLLILSVMLCGLSSGIIVGVVSPVIAKCFGIGPLWSIIPLILLGNVTLALIWHFVGKQKRLRPFSAHILALPLAALAKFAALYLGIVKLALPFWLHLPAQQAAVISGMFSIPQLITAAVGGGAAILLLPLLRRGLPAKRCG